MWPFAWICAGACVGFTFGQTDGGSLVSGKALGAQTEMHAIVQFVRITAEWMKSPQACMEFSAKRKQECAEFYVSRNQEQGACECRYVLVIR